MKQVRLTLAASFTVLSAVATAAPQTGTLTAVELDQFCAAPAGSSGARFGREVVVDGDTMLCASGVGTQATSLDALVRSGGTWVLQGNVFTGAFWGHIVALDGDLALIGMPELGQPQGAGRVLVARRSGTTWSTSWLDAPDPNTSSQFGAHVAIEGSTVVVSNPWYAHNFASEGALYVYEDTGSALVLRQSIYGGKTDAVLGWRIGLHGSDLLANFEENHLSDLRAFQRRNGVWEQSQRALGLSLSDLDPVARVAFDDWGLAVAMPDFGGAVMLATSGNGEWFVDAAFPGTPWGTQEDLQVSDGVFALNAPGDSSAASAAGAVYLYARNNGWKMMRKLTAADARANDFFGKSIELAGPRLFVGADGDDDFGLDDGAVYEYELHRDPARVYCVPQPSFGGCAAHIGFDGTPSASSSSAFTLKATKLPSFRHGFFVYGTSGRLFQAFGAGVRCFAPPRFTTAHQNTGGTTPGFSDCTGKMQFDANAFIQSGIDPQLAVGVQVDGQFVCRDADNVSGIAATDAIEFTILP